MCHNYFRSKKQGTQQTASEQKKLATHEFSNHITNIDESGKIPKPDEEMHLSLLNGFYPIKIPEEQVLHKPPHLPDTFLSGSIIIYWTKKIN